MNIYIIYEYIVAVCFHFPYGKPYGVKRKLEQFHRIIYETPIYIIDVRIHAIVLIRSFQQLCGVPVMAYVPKTDNANDFWGFRKIPKM